jgi:hypothetical protein
MEQVGIRGSNVSEIIYNPVHTGIGPFPRLIGDDEWVRYMARSVQENDPESVYLAMAHALEKSFGIRVIEEMRANESLSRLKEKIGKVGAEKFFGTLLHDLRRRLAPLS